MAIQGKSEVPRSSAPAASPNIPLVRDYMTSTLTTLNTEATLLDAALLMRRTGKRHVPIVDMNGKAVGIISDRDVSRLAPSVLSSVTQEDYNKVFETTPITRAMTKDPISVAPDAPLRQAAKILHTKKISSLLVIDKEKLVGIITTTDMLGLLNQLLSERELQAVKPRS